MRQSAEQPAQFDDHAAQQLLTRAEALEEELMAARAVQRFLLPPETQSHAPYSLKHLYHPLHHVGGDFIDTLPRPDGTLAVLIADVSGHGVAAALSTALIKTSFMRHAAASTGPAALLNAINKDLQGLMRFGRFITAEALFLSPGIPATPTSPSIQPAALLASAGHPTPILLRNGQATELDLPTGVPLLAGEEPTLPESLIPLQPADHLLLYTDGLVEAERPDGERTDLALVLKALECLLSSPHEDLTRELYEGLLFGDLTFTDDVALLDISL